MSFDLDEKARCFQALHVPGDPLVLFNIWDAGSAKAVAAAGARAIATGSWSVAHALGFDDGEHVPLDLAIDNLARIVGATDLPVTVDLESGYGPTPEGVGRTVERSLAAGAVGCNLEDSDPATGALRDPAEQAERIRHARHAADAREVPYFINARTDVFLQASPQTHDAAMVAAVLERARVYRDAGASGLFAPCLVDAGLIRRLAEASPLPLNVMVSEGLPSLRQLASLGVARVSHGAGPYASLLQSLQEASREAMQSV